MKFATALAMAVGSTTSFSTTNNECWNGEGAEHLGDCNDLFYMYCDEYMLLKDEKCNVFTFSRSAVKYLTS